MNEKNIDIIKAIKTALEGKFNGNEFQKHLINSNNRKHKTIEAFQKCLAATLSSNCKNNCQECKYIVANKPENGCEYKLYQNYWKEVNDRADIRRENIIFDGKDYELIIEIDATRADQVAKKMMSRFCYATLRNKPIVYVALLYQGTKSMNSDECKKYFKMGDEVLRKINSSNILIGYIVDKDEQKDVCYVSKCNKSFTFDDEKAFDSDLYRRYLEDHGVQSPASIDCYMLPHNKIYSSELDAKELKEYLMNNDVRRFRNHYNIHKELLKGKLTYWHKYYLYLKEKQNELNLQKENDENSI